MLNLWAPRGTVWSFLEEGEQQSTGYHPRAHQHSSILFGIDHFLQPDCVRMVAIDFEQFVEVIASFTVVGYSTRRRRKNERIEIKIQVKCVTHLSSMRPPPSSRGKDIDFDRFRPVFPIDWECRRLFDVPLAAGIWEDATHIRMRCFHRKARFLSFDCTLVRQNESFPLKSGIHLLATPFCRHFRDGVDTRFEQCSNGCRWADFEVKMNGKFVEMAGIGENKLDRRCLTSGIGRKLLWSV